MNTYNPQEHARMLSEKLARNLAGAKITTVSADGRPFFETQALATHAFFPDFLALAGTLSVIKRKETTASGSNTNHAFTVATVGEMMNCIFDKVEPATETVLTGKKQVAVEIDTQVKTIIAAASVFQQLTRNGLIQDAGQMYANPATRAEITEVEMRTGLSLRGDPNYIMVMAAGVSSTAGQTVYMRPPSIAYWKSVMQRFGFNEDKQALVQNWLEEMPPRNDASLMRGGAALNRAP